MFLFHPQLNHWQFAPYFHFAEPYPSGAFVAYADSPLTDDELANAAEALWAAELESVQTDDQTRGQPEPTHSYDTVSEFSSLDILKSMKLTQADLESMSIDEVRAVANVIDVPDRGTITDKVELIHEILLRL